MKIALFMPLNEPLQVVLKAGDEPWKNKLSRQYGIKKLDCVYPTGLLSIAAYVQKMLPGTEVRIVDCNAVMNQLASNLGHEVFSLTESEFFAACLAPLSGFEPDLVGVSALFCSNYRDLEPLAVAIRTAWPETCLTTGGHLTAAVYKHLFAQGSAFSAVCFGEGEIPVFELCQAILEQRERDFLAADPCWITQTKLQTQPDFKPQRKLLTDLDEIPPFDLDNLVFPDVYFNSTRYFFIIESQTETKEMFLFSTRGCPHRCVFCASQNVHGHKVRFYSTERIKQDILYYHQKYDIRRFVFYDDHFLVDKKRAIEILDFIAEQGFIAEIPTPAFFALTPEVTQAMYRAGIREANITIESGNEHTLVHIMHKPANLKKAEEAVRNLHDAGIIAISNILIGLPGETAESIEKGIEYLLTTEINWFQCFVAAPLPGSELYDICEQNNYFADYDIYSMDFKKCVIRTADFTPEFIERKVYEMNLRLNFVNNYDMRCGNYTAALRLFERILTNVIDTHALAYYYAAICCQKLNLTDKYSKYKDKYYEMVQKFPFWQDWVDFLQLPELPFSTI